MTVLAENDEELLYWVDEQDQVLGSVQRKKAHDEKLPHREVALLIHDEKERVLFQKRSMKKRSNPGMWSTSVAGHIGFGETAAEAVVKEAGEELGLMGRDFAYWGKEWVDDGKERYFKYWFVTEVERAYPFNVNREEVDEVKFFTKLELEDWVKKSIGFNKLFVERAYLFWDNQLESYLKGKTDEQSHS